MPNALLSERSRYLHMKLTKVVVQTVMASRITARLAAHCATDNNETVIFTRCSLFIWLGCEEARK